MQGNTWIRGHLFPLIFGVSMFGLACSQSQLEKTSATYDSKVSPTVQSIGVATTQAAGTIVALAPAGTPINTIANYVLMVSGAIIAADRLISGGLKAASANAALNAAKPAGSLVAKSAPPTGSNST